MKYAALALSAILFGSMSLVAQNADRSTPSVPVQQPGKDAPRRFVYDFNAQHRMVILAEAANGGCPVSMHAQQLSNAGMMNTRGTTAGTLAQRIHLTVGDGAYASAILSVKITVHGTTAKARFLPVSASRTALSDAAMTFDLRAGGASAEAISSDLLLRGFTSVQSVSLESVNYSDGSTWISSAGKSCSISPDGMMLVR